MSSTVLNACDILAKIGPVLKTSGILFKAPASLDVLMTLNSGVAYGYSQVGKAITIYPRDELEFIRFVEMLEPLLRRWSSNPAVPFDLRLKKTCIYYRYGAFRSKMDSRSGGETSSVISPDGSEIEDRRNLVPTQLPWLKDPFEGRRNSSRELEKSPLNGQYVVYRALSQRGKGGVYECLDMRHDPPRKCILKEGRRHGETDWDGRDGRSRIQNEARVLTTLAGTEAAVPHIYDRFIVNNNEYLVIERINGINLGKLIACGKKRLSLHVLLKICLQLCQIVDSIHRLGLLWRDCKLSNFVVDIEGTVRAIDFEGACRRQQPDHLLWSSPLYMAPEMTKPGYLRVTGNRQDLFALGVCVFYVLEGKFPAQDPKDNLGRLICRAVPIEIKRLVTRLLSHDPHARPEAGFVAKAILQSLAQPALCSSRKNVISIPSRVTTRQIQPRCEPSQKGALPLATPGLDAFL